MKRILIILFILSTIACAQSAFTPKQQAELGDSLNNVVTRHVLVGLVNQLTDTHINASAGIDVSKAGLGTTNNTELGYISTLSANVEDRLDNIEAGNISGDPYLLSMAASQSLSTKFLFYSGGGTGFGAGTGGMAGIPFESSIDVNNYSASNSAYRFMILYEGLNDPDNVLTIVDKITGKVRNVYWFNEANTLDPTYYYPQDDDVEYMIRAKYDMTVDSVSFALTSEDAIYDSSVVRIWHGPTYATASRVFVTDIYVTESPKTSLVYTVRNSGFNDATIAMDEQIWVEFETVNGIPSSCPIELFYTRN